MGDKIKAKRQWRSMVDRCTKPKHHKYKNYGARGIKVCERWIISYANFKLDMGERPDGCTIDRIDNNGNYEPGNCRWATVTEQSRNKTNTVFLEVDGVTKSIGEWAEITGMDTQTIYGRYKLGWKGKDLFKPKRPKRPNKTPLTPKEQGVL